MKLSSAVIASAVLLVAASAIAQTSAPPAAAPAVPVPATKRVTCLATTQNLQGQDKRDQMQLCMAQARFDCLKQAIDQKLVGEPRRSFVKTCVGADRGEQ
jgi:hypothetical protein